MNQITKKLTVSTPAVSLQIAQEQTVEGLQGLYDLVNFMRQDDPEVKYIAKEIERCADLISIACKNIYEYSSKDKQEALEIADQIVKGWQSLAKQAVTSMERLANKYD